MSVARLSLLTGARAMARVYSTATQYTHTRAVTSTAEDRNAALSFGLSMRRRNQIRYFALGWTIPSRKAIQPIGNHNAHCTEYYKLLLNTGRLSL